MNNKKERIFLTSISKIFFRKPLISSYWKYERTRSLLNSFFDICKLVRRFCTILSFFVLVLFFAGCAKPNYINKTTDPSDHKTNENSQNASEKLLDCKLAWKKLNICLTWSWKKYPTQDETGSMLLRLYRFSNLDQYPELIDTTNSPQLLLWMPSMNHGSSPTSTQKISAGTFQVDDVFFVMPGAWDLHFKLTDEENGSDEIVESIRY